MKTCGTRREYLELNTDEIYQQIPLTDNPILLHQTAGYLTLFVLAIVVFNEKHV